MSGTKLLFPKAPAINTGIKPALLIVTHGERGGLGDDRLTTVLVEKLQHLRQYRSVKTCFISKAPSLSNVFNELSPGPVIIYPLFMSDGYFVRQVIPRSIGINGSMAGNQLSQVEVLAPFGLNPQLPQLIADLARSTAKKSNLAPQDCHMLLVAHGSKHDRASRNATLALAVELAKTNVFAGINPCFLDENPFLPDQLQNVKGPAIAVGLFVGEGMHGAVDLPEAIKKSGRADIMLSSPLARCPGLTDMICNDLIENTTWPETCGQLHMVV